MNQKEYIAFLERNKMVNEITEILESFDEKHMELHYKKGFYIYGSPGSGKTHFVMTVLQKLGYDVIKYDAGDIRNKSLIDTITSNNISNRNVLDMMSGKNKKIAIVMDEIDGMNNGDKGGLNALIKLIRQKKTKKQKLEHCTMNPIFCIGNYSVDKKIKELIKVCNVFEIKSPTRIQMSNILDTVITQESFFKNREKILDYIQGDMRKLSFVQQLYQTKSHLLTEDALDNIFQIKSFNADSKTITANLINAPIPFDNQQNIMNDTDRTIVALLWHENIPDALSKIPVQHSFPFYVDILDNICFADYIDRITFQNQIWLFNEMSCFIKTFYNNYLYHKTFSHSGKFRPDDIRFTKILTKYSTEYNNMLFLYNMTQQLNMDKKDLIAFFQELRMQMEKDNENTAEMKMDQIECLFENYNITKLDVRRMYRFMDKNIKKDAVLLDECDDD
jgi:DNA polymerase III delta prime subunit